MAERWVALLRGVNVGGANRLRMADLRATMVAEGMTNVVTHVQSGNLLFDHPADDAARVGEIVATAIASHHGLTVPVVVRTASELRRVAVSHPDDGVVEPRYLHVVFFDRSVEPASAVRLDAAPFAPDRFVVDGGEAYVTYPAGSARSTLTIDVFERAFGVIATARNMNSVARIAALADDR